MNKLFPGDPEGPLKHGFSDMIITQVNGWRKGSSGPSSLVGRLAQFAIIVGTRLLVRFVCLSFDSVFEFSLWTWRLDAEATTKNKKAVGFLPKRSRLS